MPLASLRRSRPDEGFDDGEGPSWSADDSAHRAARRRPSPEARRPMLAGVGVLVVVACTAVGAEVATHVDHRSSYLAVATYVAQGAVVEPNDLAAVSTGLTSGVAAIPSADEAAVTGRRASEPLEPGSLLVPDDLSDTLPLPSSEALVGASLGTDQAPAGLTPGDPVIVVLSGPDSGLPTGSPSSPGSGSGASGTSSSGGSSGPSTPSTVTGSPSPGGGSRIATGQGELAIGIVYAIELPSSNDQAASPGNELVTLEVPKAAASEIAAASAAGDVSLAEISTGTS